MSEEMIGDRTKAMQERLRRKVHRGKFMPGGGTIDANGKGTMWGGEKFMEYANDDGPQAAALIDELLSAYNPNERLREALERIADETVDWQHIQEMRDVARSALSPLPQGEDT